MLADKLRAATASAGTLPEFVSSRVNRVSATSNTVTAPTGIQNGDLLIALTYMGASTTVTPPSGFSQIYAEYASNPFFSVNVKTAASESGNYTFTASASGNFTVVMLVYRNATRVNTLGGINRASSTDTATALSITPSFRGVLLAAFSHSSTATISTPPSGMTQRAAPPASAVYATVYELSPQEAAATDNKTLVWGSSGNVSGVQLQITNEPTVAPEFVASASTQNGSFATSLTINKPTGTVEGDLMVAVMGGNNNRTWTGDTGWTEAADLTNAPHCRVAYKIAGASEGASYTFAASGNGTYGGSILTYRYAVYDTIGAYTTSTNPLILPSISPSQSQSVLIATGFRDSASVTLGTPTGMTARITNADATSPSYIVCDQTVAAGPTGTRSMSTGSTSSVAGIMLSIKPTRSL